MLMEKNIMIQLENILRNNIIVIIYICINLTLFFTIFVLKRKIEKEPDFNKRINYRFLLKYVIMCMIIIGAILAITIEILAFKFKNFGICSLIVSYAFLSVSIEWAFIFDKIDIYSDISKDKVVEQYISLFAKNDMSNYKYLEVITWFSRWNHEHFQSRDNNQEIDQLIIKLELCLRPNGNGLCLASHHKNAFTKLCDKLVDCQPEEQLKEIVNEANEMKKNPPEKYKIFSLGLDHNILIYMIIIVFHLSAIVLIGGKLNIIIGNILFYIPSDILAILIYKGILIQIEESQERK